MATREALGIVFAIGFAFVASVSIDRWTSVAEGQPEQIGLFWPPIPATEEERTSLGRERLQQFKEQFVEAADVQQFHNDSAAAMGLENWADARATLYPRLWTRMIQDTGNVLPTDEELLQWARENPESVREVIRSIAK